MSTATLTKTADEYRAEAAEQSAEAAASFERCDTDGFASQAASTIMSSLNRLKAEIVEQGGTWEFPALFDLDGNLLNAKQFRGKYGWSWAIRDADDELLGYLSPSTAQDEARRRAANAKKGYNIGTIRAEAYAINTGDGHGFSGLASVHPVVRQSREGAVTVVDNGQ